jgi:hypothetical protein
MLSSAVRQVWPASPPCPSWPFPLAPQRCHMQHLVKHGLTDKQAMKTYRGVERWLHGFLTQALNASERSRSRPNCFILGERASGRAQTQYELCGRRSVPVLTPVFQPVLPRDLLFCTLKMETESYSEMLVNTKELTRRHIPEESTRLLVCL